MVLRVPYPLSFYAKGLDGRIDDANAGWKGRGVWTTSGDRVPWLKEGARVPSRLPSTSSSALTRSPIKERAAGSPPGITGSAAGSGHSFAGSDERESTRGSRFKFRSSLTSSLFG